MGKGVTFAGGGEKEVNMSRRMSTSEELSTKSGDVVTFAKGTGPGGTTTSNDTSPSNTSDWPSLSRKDVIDMGKHDVD